MYFTNERTTEKEGSFVASSEIVIKSGYSRWLLPLTCYSGERWN